jgi:hypothetical protein
VFSTPRERRATAEDALFVPELSPLFHTGPGSTYWVIYVILLSFRKICQVAVLAFATSKIANK